MIVVHFKFDDALNKHDNLGLHFNLDTFVFLAKVCNIKP